MKVHRTLLALPLLAACGGGEAPPSPAPVPSGAAAGETELASALRFVDATQGSGLEAALNRSGTLTKDYVTDSFGAGAALLDFNRDGHLDLFLAGGGLHSPDAEGPAPMDRLLAGDGQGRFTDVTEAAGIETSSWSYGVLAADLDGDGWLDLYVTCRGANRLWRNRGDGTFEERAAAAGVASDRWSSGAAVLDYDRDGDLDLYVVNHIDFDKGAIDAETKRDVYLDQTVYYGPRGLTPQADQLFRNEGEGRYTDVSLEAGLTARPLFGFQAVVLDVDRDGWLDVYVANDSQPNQLWRNRGDGSFEDIALRNGAALSMEGGPQAGMGVAVGDADGDGWADLFVTNFSEDYFTLYRGAADGRFRDVTRRARLMQPTLASLGWGTAFHDFDQDGDLDLFAANGHVFPQMDDVPAGPGYAQRDQLFENLGEGRFAEPVGGGGPGLEPKAASRAAVAGDLDRDGDLDLVVTHLDGTPSVLLNESDGGGALHVSLEGPRGEATVVGARVTVRLAGRELLRLSGTQQGFLSSEAGPLHFGLGDAQAVERLEVRWPDGSVSVQEGLRPGQHVRLRQGQDTVDLGPIRTR